MPLYPFINVETEEEYEHYFSPSEVNNICKIGEVVEIEGIKYKRIFPTLLKGMSDTQSVDPYSYNDFKRLTSDKQMTVGDMQDLSAQMSEKRAEKDGVDSFKEKHYDKYSKMRKGTKHMNDTRPNIKTEFKGRTTPKLPQ